MKMENSNWNLVADIGGTNARFGVYDITDCRVVLIKIYSVKEHRSFSDALSKFILDVYNELGLSCDPAAVCLAVACPVDGDVVKFTNSPWEINRVEVSQSFGNIPTLLINDFAAVGWAVADLKADDWIEVHSGEARQNFPIGVLGPGTGLGVCTLIPVDVGFKVIQGEGGHVDFSPVTVEEIKILEALASDYSRVSAERILSGTGIVNIYRCLTELPHDEVELLTPEKITTAAKLGADKIALRTIQIFLNILGSYAGNLALTIGAKGGIYIAGGITPIILELIKSSDFCDRFEAKGRFQGYLNQVPIRVIVKANLGLIGAANILNSV